MLQDKETILFNDKTAMQDEELYGNLSPEDAQQYAEEARQRWGYTDAYKQSQERVKKMGKEGLKKVLEENRKLTVEIADAMKAGEDRTSLKVQALIARHYDGLRAFYEPNYEIYLGLAEMYVSDIRFKAHYEKVAIGLAEYLRDAMIYFVDTKEKK